VAVAEGQLASVAALRLYMFFFCSDAFLIVPRVAWGSCSSRLSLGFSLDEIITLIGSLDILVGYSNGWSSHGSKKINTDVYFLAVASHKPSHEHERLSPAYNRFTHGLS